MDAQDKPVEPEEAELLAEAQKWRYRRLCASLTLMIVLCLASGTPYLVQISINPKNTTSYPVVVLLGLSILLPLPLALNYGRFKRREGRLGVIFGIGYPTRSSEPRRPPGDQRTHVQRLEEERRRREAEGGDPPPP